jgi:hypothetical protein
MRRLVSWVRSFISVSSEDLDYSSRRKATTHLRGSYAERRAGSVTKMLC